MSTLTKAVIPIAGLGTRMGPLCRAVPKALLPLPAPGPGMRPVVHEILAEVSAADIDEAGLIVRPDHREAVSRYLEVARAEGADDLPEVTLIDQPQPEGFGEAVLRASDFTDGKAFLLMLGDHVFDVPAGGEGPAREVAGSFSQYQPAAMVGVQVVGEAELAKVGACRGSVIEEGVYRCTRLIEKPSVQAAREQLRTPGLAGGQYLAHAGVYAFGPEMMETLAAMADEPRREGQELELADAQLRLLESGSEYLLRRVTGRPEDTGSIGGYAAAFARRADFDG